MTSLIDITNGNMGDGIQYTYSAYGRMYIENTGADLGMLISDVNTLTFKSYSYDSDLGMYYLGSRWYDPEVCRRISSDSIEVMPKHLDDRLFILSLDSQHFQVLTGK